MTVNSIAALRALTGYAASDYVYALGFYSVNDGGDGGYFFDAATTDDDDGWSIIRPDDIASVNPGRWIALFENDVINFKRMGAVADGSTDNHAILQGFLDNHPAGLPTNIYFPPGNYFFSDTITVAMRVNFTGETRTTFKFPAGVLGMHVTRSSSGEQYSVFDQLTLEAYGKDAADGKDENGNKSTDNDDYHFHGCLVTAVSTFRDVNIGGFSGCGLVVYGELSAGFDASLSRFENIKLSSNNGHGVWVVGPDANQIHFSQIDARDNGRYGIYDQSFLGCMWYTCHCNNNAEGPYLCRNVTAQSTFENCYSEMYDPNENSNGFTHPSRFENTPAIIIGGLHGAGVVGGHQIAYHAQSETAFGNMILRDGGIVFPLEGDNENALWRLGTPDVTERDNSGADNAVSLRHGRFDPDVMNFLRGGSYYYGRLNATTAVAVRKLMVGGKLQTGVNTPADLDNYGLMQVYMGDRLINNNYNGKNPEGWVCTKPGMTSTFPGTVTAVKNGPTLYFSDIDDIRIGDIIEWNGGRYRILEQDNNNPAFYTDPEPSYAASPMPVSYPYPVFTAYGVAKGTTAERPANLTADDSGWQYYDTDLSQHITWDGAAWI